ncbi:hypothetical protein GX50_02916 [[Emmonsia] crescens]|uniref:Uncharacterized protein n=1 Tax=[Emmonsia] crescens TaxID=73230 RepID=A0A2B7ZM31_9EURO|nr:hypothetical protein GX50_02916 [Emmonsia crescens]
MRGIRNCAYWSTRPSTGHLKHQTAATSQISRASYHTSQQRLHEHNNGSARKHKPSENDTTLQPASQRDSGHDSDKDQPSKQTAKTVALADEELREKLDEMMGEGGVSALELEDGKPVAMKRSVKNNMFRLI